MGGGEFIDFDTTRKHRTHSSGAFGSVSDDTYQKIGRVTSADDVGKAINRSLVEGQIEGGVIQSLGYTITENFVMKEGVVYKQPDKR